MLPAARRVGVHAAVNGFPAFMFAHQLMIRFLLSVAARIRRSGPITLLAITLAGVIGTFVGCISLHDIEIWKPRQPEAAPPEVIVDRQIRVRLFDLPPQKKTALSISSPFSIIDGKAGRTISDEHAPLENAEVGGAKRDVITVGNESFATNDLLITPKRDAAIVLNRNTYRGLLRIIRGPEGLKFINIVDVEAYLRGVLRGELPGYFHPEAFAAQCVAARTYVLWQKENGTRGRNWDVVDDEGSQMYIGVRGEDPIAVEAVERTRGEVCFSNDNGEERLFCTYYSSACGGLSQHVNNVKARDPSPRPLWGNVKCDDCSPAPFYRWPTVKISRGELTRRLIARYPSLKKLGTISELRPKALTSDGRIIRIELVGSGGGKDTLIGEDFRLAVGAKSLKSTNFKISTQGEMFVFSDGRGFGHGMGLCQYGMEAKARGGMSHREILQIYYPGSVIKKIY